jgi:hypothetical protein
MADEAIGDFYEAINQGGKVPHESEKRNATLKAALATAKLGMFGHRAGESNLDIDLAVTTDGAGAEYIAELANTNEVVRTDPDWDIDTVLPLLTKVKTYLRGCGAIVPAFLETTAGPVAVEIGDLVSLGTEAGKVRKHVYADAALATDTLEEVVGEVVEADPGSAADDHIILIRL